MLSSLRRVLEVNAGFAVAFHVADQAGAIYHDIQGTTKYTAGDYTGAIAAYTEAIDLDPTDANCYGNRGACKYALGDYAGATEDYRRAIRLNSTDITYHISCAACKYISGDYIGAILDYNDAIDLDPQNHSYYAARGDCHCALDNHQSVIEDYSQAINLDPNNPIYHSNRAASKDACGRHFEAMIDYTEAMRLDPHNADYPLKKAASEARDFSKRRLFLILDNPSCNTAQVWDQLGDDYFFEKGKTKDYINARICYERAISLNPNYAGSLYCLGLIYQRSYGVKEDLPRAREYHRIAAAQGYYPSERELFVLNHLGKQSVDEWCEFGDDYCQNAQSNNTPADYVQARMCYEHLINDLNRSHVDANYKLGTLYHLGNGGSIDLVKAQECYQRAAQERHYPSKRELLILVNPQINTANAWCQLGDNYYQDDQSNNDPADYVQARICYELAIHLNPLHADANYNLGALYHRGNGVDIDHEKARTYYRVALQGNHPCARNNLKELEKDVFLKLRATGASLNTKYSEDKTVLHRAAENRHFKNCARLIFFGASTEVRRNPELPQSVPLADLKDEENGKITILQKKVERLNTALRKSPAIIITEKISEQLAEHDEDSKELSLRWFEDIYKNPSLGPLLDLAKLAVLGLHDLSARPKSKYKLSGQLKPPGENKDENYDSDKDATETVDPDLQFLGFSIDPYSPNVNNSAHFGEYGLGGMGACGVVIPAAPNTLHVAANRPLEEYRGTFIHELTHFVAQEIFKNSFNPYASGDVENRKRFAAIASKLEQRTNLLDPILKGAFLPNYKRHNQIHGELIVRTAQIIFRNPNWLESLKEKINKLEKSKKPKESEELKELLKCYEELLQYYNEVFLDAVKKHTSILQDRALVGWPIKEPTTTVHMEAMSFK